MELSKRLSAVAAMVTPGNVVCDVGCDHGYVSIFLVETKKSPKVYAMDVNKGPLERAAKHVQEAGYEDYIKLILSDGLDRMPDGQADTLICAGMGGRLVIRILSEGIEKVRKLKELILQPQSEMALVREYLRSQGFVTDREDMVFEEGKYYPVLHVCIPVQKAEKEKVTDKVEAGSMSTKQQVFDKYGERLLRQKHPVLKDYLLWESELLSQIEEELEKSGKNSEKTRQRYETLQEEKRLIGEALAYFD